MSGLFNQPAYDFVRVEETRGYLTLHYRDDTDEHALTLSAHDEPGAFTLVGTYFPGRGSDETGEAQLLLHKDGCEGVDLPEGFSVTHSLAVKLPKQDTYKLAHRLFDFTHSAEDVVKAFARSRAHLDDLAFGDDHLTITSNYDTLTLGLIPERYRFAFTDYKPQGAPIRGFLYLQFGFTDENGEPFHVKFAAPDDDAARIDGELRDFFRARPEFGKKVGTFGIADEQTQA